MENKVEIWKSYPYIAGIEVSTLGRVRTIDRVVPCIGNRTRLVKGRVLKQRDNGLGYLQVGITIDRKWTMKLVQRLVAQTFLSNPNNLPEVNHKNGDRMNNNISNLEWCSQSYNIQYREKFGKASGHPVFAINLATLEVSKFRSQHEAGRELGVHNSNINSVIRGRYKQAGNFWFVNADDNAVDIINQKLHDIGGIGLKIKQGR